MTRVATLQWTHGQSGTRFSWLGQTDGHHGLSHEADDDGTIRGMLVDINYWYAEQLAYLLDRMKAIPEGDGTMLDNTIVLWGNELGKGNSHTRTQIPFVMAGGKNAGIAGGRFLTYQDVPNNRLLVSVLNALGIDVDTYGDLDNGSGGLPGL